MQLRRLTLAALLALLPAAASAQSAGPVVAAASKAMGADSLNSVTYSGTARNGAFGQSKAIGDPMGPVNVFISPPFADLEQRLNDFRQLVADMQTKLPSGSVLTVQVEDNFDVAVLPDAGRWEARKYGRNVLLFWEPADTAPAE